MIFGRLGTDRVERFYEFLSIISCCLLLSISTLFFSSRYAEEMLLWLHEWIESYNINFLSLFSLCRLAQFDRQRRRAAQLHTQMHRHRRLEIEINKSSILSLRAIAHNVQLRSHLQLSAGAAWRYQVTATDKSLDDTDNDSNCSCALLGWWLANNSLLSQLVILSRARILQTCFHRIHSKCANKSQWVSLSSAQCSEEEKKIKSEQ